MRNFIVLFICLFFPPVRLKNIILNVFGHSIESTARIGFIFFRRGRLILRHNSVISSFSYFSGVDVDLGKNSRVGLFNIFSGYFDVELSAQAVLANFLVFKNGGVSVIPNKSSFKLGDSSKLTSHHFIDMSSNVHIGSNSVLGGRDIQVWTHGFIHFDFGRTRYIKFGDIVIGDGVYIGARSTLSPGTIVENEICFTSACSIAGIYDVPGYYAPAKLVCINSMKKDEFIDSNSIDFDYKCGNPRVRNK